MRDADARRRRDAADASANIQTTSPLVAVPRMNPLGRNEALVQGDAAVLFHSSTLLRQSDCSPLVFASLASAQGTWGKLCRETQNTSAGDKAHSLTCPQARPKMCAKWRSLSL